MNEQLKSEIRNLKANLGGSNAIPSASIDIKDYLKLREIQALERIAASLENIAEMYNKAD